MYNDSIAILQQDSRRRDPINSVNEKQIQRLAYTYNSNKTAVIEKQVDGTLAENICLLMKNRSVRFNIC